ncbi:metadherin a isoform X2 [Pygocentrus nattereri]|uniref:metadherin a isoform X2 n=1 Tax=Pygocentrus nattereri TaxID=42514 RepID=UPI0008145385|nr:metadherin a isoform X2 [Pygocentrus nattereri]
MAATWRAAALEQAELVSDRLRRLASSGLHFLHSEFGLDLGVNPELWPSWVIITATLIGLLVAVWWVVACGGAARRKRGTGTKESSVNVNVTVAATTVTDRGKAPLAKTVRTEEPKKKSKKKAGEKKTQPNGRTAPEHREEIKVIQEAPKQAPVVAAAAAPPAAAAAPAPPPAQPLADKVDKAKKSKKKTKPEVKQSQSVSTTDGKEPDEGAWETKVSNREKRQQRRKDKGPGDDSGSPGGGNHAGQLTEQPVVSAPANTKKNKELLNSKAEKADKTEKAEKRVDIDAAAPPSWNPVNSGSWTEKPVKLPPQVSASDSKKWSVGVKTSGHRNSEPLAWGQESEGSWANMDGRIKTELNTVKFSMLGLNSSAGNPVAQSATDMGKWETVPAVDVQWSGFNGLGAADPSSDWNAPTEVWGNYEEAKAETPATQQTPVSQLPKLQDSEDEKEKGDPSGSSKSKRKKRKKKKPEDENTASQVNAEGRPAPAESSAVKPRPHVPQEEPAKQNVLPPASQKKTEQNWEQPKQVQKKKARRET